MRAPPAPGMFCTISVGIAGNMPAHVFGEGTGEKIVAAAGARRDDDRHGLPAIEIRDRVCLGRGDHGRQPKHGSNPTSGLECSTSHEHPPKTDRRLAYPGACRDRTPLIPRDEIVMAGHSLSKTGWCPAIHVFDLAKDFKVWTARRAVAVTAIICTFGDQNGREAPLLHHHRDLLSERRRRISATPMR